MKRRVIRPAEEETEGAFTTVFFSVVWYCVIYGMILQSGFQISLLLFLAAGLLPLFQAVNIVRRAFFYRRQRKDAVVLGNRKNGRIVGITRQDIPYSNHHGRLRYRRYYFLEVEITDPDTGITSRIQSQGYRRPIHRYLSSDKVTVYTDRSGWKYYLEDFQWKEHKHDPDIFDYPNEFEEIHLGAGRITQIIFAVILILMVFNVFLQR